MATYDISNISTKIPIPTSLGNTTVPSIITGGVTTTPMISKPSVTPVVVTANQAKTDIKQNVQTLNTAKTDIQTQQAKIAADKAAADVKAQNDAKAKADADVLAAKNKLDADKLALEKSKVDTANSMADQPDAGMKFVWDKNGNRVQMPVGANIASYGGMYSETKPETSTTTPADKEGLISSAITRGVTDVNELYNELGSKGVSIDDIKAYTGSENGNYLLQTTINANNIQKMADDTQKTIDQYNSGTLPLTPSQQAQVDSLKKQYETIRQQLVEANKNYTGGTTTMGIRSGRSEYAPELAAGEIQKSITDGLNALSTHDATAAAAVSKMEEAFRTGNLEALKSLKNEYQTAMTNKQKLLDTIHKEMTDKADALAKKNEDAQAKVESEKAKLLADIAKTGATPEIIDAVSGATTLAEAYKAAGNYALGGSGTEGEYNAYKRDELLAGRDPMTFSEYQTVDANRKIAQARAAAGASGLSTTELARIDKQNNFLAGQPATKDFATIQDKYMNVKKNVGNGDGASDIAIIYDFMKTLDPTSVVRETEYNTGAQKTGNIFAGKLATLNGMLKPKGGFISETAKANIMNVLDNYYQNKRSQYVNLRDQVIKNLESQGVNSASDFILDYDMHADMIAEDGFDAADYLVANPDKQTQFSQIKEENPQYSDYEVYQVLNAQ